MKKLIPNSQSLIPEKDILVYQGETGVKMTVKTDGETVWLTQEQMCQLFGRDRSVITKHIRNIFKEGELPQEGFVQNLHITSDIGGRPVSIYNLDVVISVGYRVNTSGQSISTQNGRAGDWRHIAICRRENQGWWLLKPRARVSMHNARGLVHVPRLDPLRPQRGVGRLFRHGGNLAPMLLVVRRPVGAGQSQLRPLPVRSFAMPTTALRAVANAIVRL